MASLQNTKPLFVLFGFCALGASVLLFQNCGKFSSSLGMQSQSLSSMDQITAFSRNPIDNPNDMEFPLFKGNASIGMDSDGFYKISANFAGLYSGTGFNLHLNELTCVQSFANTSGAFKLELNNAGPRTVQFVSDRSGQAFVVQHFDSTLIRGSRSIFLLRVGVYGPDIPSISACADINH